MKYLFGFIILINITMVYFACTCDPDFVVNEENFNNTFFVVDINADCKIEEENPTFGYNKISRELIITFNKPVNKSTVVIGQNILLDPFIDYSEIYYNDSDTELHMVYCTHFREDSDSIQNCFYDLGQFKVTMVGEDYGIRSLIEEQLIDGDGDGKDGGDGEYDLENELYCGSFVITDITSDIFVDTNFCYNNIDIYFNKPVDESAFFVNEVLEISPDDYDYDYSFITPYIFRLYLCSDCPITTADFLFKENGDFKIRSMEGQILDADKDGVDGGNETYKVDVGCQ